MALELLYFSSHTEPPQDPGLMQTRLFLIAALLLSATLSSCSKKQEAATCITPNKELIQGSWKQDFPKDPAFQPPPEWERIEFRDDSFFMRIRNRTDMITEANCYQYTWLNYAKGIYNIDADSMKIYFDGVYTDSNYVIKTNGCHSIGTYNPTFGISRCDHLLMLKIILRGYSIPQERLNSIPEERLTIKMYRD
jgi:hypothetical protein